MIYKIFRSLFLISFIVLSLIAQPTAKCQILPVFTPYYNGYMVMVKSKCNSSQYRHILHIQIIFGDLSKLNDEGLTTVLHYRILFTNIIWHDVIITIDKKQWDIADEGERLQLMYHELTHAYFGYPDLRESKYQKHYMYYKMNNIEYDEISKQVLELISSICKK